MTSNTNAEQAVLAETQLEEQSYRQRQNEDPSQKRTDTRAVAHQRESALREQQSRPVLERESRLRFESTPDTPNVPAPQRKALIQKAARQFGTSGLVDPVVADRHSSANLRQEYSSASESATNEQHRTPSPPDVPTARQAGSPEQCTDPSKLRFDDSEQPQHSHEPQKAAKQSDADKRVAKAQSKAEHSAGKLEKAKAELPKKYRLDNSPTVDAESGKIKRGLHFKAKSKSLHEHREGSPLARPFKAGANAGIAYGRIVVRPGRVGIVRQRRKLKKFKKFLDSGQMALHSIRNSYMSWRGYIAHKNARQTIRSTDGLYTRLFGVSPLVKI